MEILLVNSPIYEEKTVESETYLIPLGLGYLATKLKEENIDVQILDAVTEQLSVKEVTDYINLEKPNHIGFNIFTQNRHLVKRIVENINYETTILLGAKSAIFLKDEIIKWDVKNKIIIVNGEAEYFLPDLIKNKLTDQPVFELNNILIYDINIDSNYFIWDIDALKIDYQFFKHAFILNKNNNIEIPIITSRGCPFNCAFCGGARDVNKKTKVRLMSKDAILSNIQNIVNDYPELKEIRVLDDLFLMNNQRIKEAIQIFSSFKNIKWRAMVHINSLINAFDLLEDLNKSGCIELFIGIESGSPMIREYINKVGKIDDILAVIGQLLKNNINVKGYFIYGFPKESKHDMELTYQLAASLKKISENTQGQFRVSAFQFRPYHGTKIYNDLVASGFEIGDLIKNDNLAINGRSQFSFQADNYSAADEKEVIEYVNKTQLLNGCED